MSYLRWWLGSCIWRRSCVRSRDPVDIFIYRTQYGCVYSVIRWRPLTRHVTLPYAGLRSGQSQAYFKLFWNLEWVQKWHLTARKINKRNTESEKWQLWNLKMRGKQARRLQTRISEVVCIKLKRSSWALKIQMKIHAKSIKNRNWKNIKTKSKRLYE